ncbi:F-box protein, partial [Candidatus Bathyarchaeota archaeon]|nr:F-box protein [Candidatus Bathyarchaeota archaeon]
MQNSRGAVFSAPKRPCQHLRLPTWPAPSAKGCWQAIVHARFAAPALEAMNGGLRGCGSLELVRRSHSTPSLKHTLVTRITVYSRSRLSTEAYLSGIGRQELVRLVVPPGHDGHPIPDDKLLTIWLMRSSFEEPGPQLQESHAWGFPFHESCWRILALARQDEEVDVQALFDIFRSFPVQDGIINFGHDYGGDACYEWHPGTVPVGKELGLFRGRPVGSRMSDPLELSELRCFFEEGYGSREREPGCDTVAHTYHTRVDPFSKMPMEILQRILEYLPTTDVLHLKQSSAAFANLPLPQSFWKSRFLPGREFEAVFEAVFEARSRQHAASLRGRWQALYHLIRSIRRSDPFANRERVWKLAGSLWGIIDQATSTSLCGNGNGHLDALRWVDAHTALKQSKDVFSSGSRAFYHRTFTFPASVLQVFVSLVQIHRRRYVSGIRVEAADGSSSVLGYQHAANEILISVAEPAMA